MKWANQAAMLGFGALALQLQLAGTISRTLVGEQQVRKISW